MTGRAHHTKTIVVPLVVRVIVVANGAPQIIFSIVPRAALRLVGTHFSKKF
jgi:hypothetical protein